MEAETMTVLLGGKPVIEDLHQIFGWDANAVIDDTDADLVGAGFGNSNDKSFYGVRPGLHGMFCVAKQIDQNLQYLMAIDAHGWGIMVKFTDKVDVMPVEGRGVYPQRI